MSYRTACAAAAISLLYAGTALAQTAPDGQSKDSVTATAPGAQAPATNNAAMAGATGTRPATSKLAISGKKNAIAEPPNSNASIGAGSKAEAGN